MSERDETRQVEAVATVTKSGSKTPETQEQERIPSEKFTEAPAYVMVKAGATVNLGNYESARVDVSLSYPCRTEEVDATFDKVKKWVDKRVGEEYAEMKGNSNA